PGLLSELEFGEKYSKFPLENDALEPHFDDDLSDVSPFYRLQLGPLYKQQLQQRLMTYQPYLEKLKRNAAARISANKPYQNFLKEVQKKNYDSEPVEVFGQADLQLVEAMNVMKDYIFLSALDEMR
ncbi:MAG: carboxy terminal-processing peptidase, partial [Chlamydiia bacterium]|nr:carboxy terminal-processing peptidase [Chlamydiia bacterium]